MCTLPEDLKDLVFEEDDNVLEQRPEDFPDWLNQPRDALNFTRDNFDRFLGSRVVYYPGSGTDGHAITLFGGAHNAHCFVHCDFEAASCQKVVDQFAA